MADDEIMVQRKWSIASLASDDSHSVDSPAAVELLMRFGLYVSSFSAYLQLHQVPHSRLDSTKQPRAIISTGQTGSLELSKGGRPADVPLLLSEPSLLLIVIATALIEKRVAMNVRILKWFSFVLNYKQRAEMVF